MIWLGFLLIAVASLAGLIYSVILMQIGMKAQQVSPGLRLAGALSINAACWFGAVGFWFVSSTDPLALLLLLSLAVLMGLFLSWSLLPVKPQARK